jgi:4-hydroxybenzoyl-CoA reductase subunit alpha
MTTAATPPTKFQLVGKPIPQVGSRRKVAGEALYTDDLRLHGTLVGKILRSPHAAARVVSIDVSEAEKLPGVRAVVTGRDAPRPFGVLPISKDEPAMAVDRVRYVGEPVAGVAADDERIAIAATRLIKVVYETTKPVETARQALAEVAKPSEKIHPETKHKNNLHKQVEQRFGDPEAAFAASAHVARGDFRFAGVTHSFTEPMVATAHYDREGRLHVYSATQVPHYLHRALSEVLDVPMHRIRVVRPNVGGGFGGKSDPFPHEMIAALLSRKCRRPVEIRFDREEVFLSHHGRHPSEITVAVGVDGEGKLSALDVDALIDGGAYGSFGVVTSYYNGVLAQGPYRIPNFKYRGRRAYTNKPMSGAMRGHGAVNTRFAFETLFDECAAKLGLDPLEMRLQNALPSYTETINGFRITSNGVKECLEKVREASGWRDKRGKLPYGRGIGVACSFYISGSALPIHRTRAPQTTVHLKVDMDGGVTVHNLAAEIGQGSDTVLAQCVAEVLGLDLSWIRVRSEDTDTAPFDLGAYSSRQTFMCGNAAIRAAERIRERLLEAAARLSGGEPRDYELRGGMAEHRADPTRSVSYMDALEEAMADKGALLASGSYQSPKLGGAYKGAGAGLSPTYSFGAYVCETDVDPETGFVRPVKVWAAHDCGRALNPLAVKSQIIGCVHMGLGQALMEEWAFNPRAKGNLKNPSLLDYPIPTILEMPDVDVIIVESDDQEGPFGAKEAGEGPLLPILPALGNAVYDAVGVRVRELPMSPHRVLRAIKPNDAAAAAD